MNRKDLLQKLIDHYDLERYLEIGVHKGKTFFTISCKYKLAVDPAFRIPPGVFLRSLLKDPNNLRNQYFMMTSDLFFEKKGSKTKQHKYPDLVFIDGLHTFSASLRDAINSLNFISPNGFIVLHDCYPPNAAAATPAKSLIDAKNQDVPGWTGTWCGDVWKTIVYLKKKYAEALEIKVFNSDMGLALISRSKEMNINREIDINLYNSINKMEYDDLQKEPETLINLCDPENLGF